MKRRKFKMKYDEKVDASGYISPLQPGPMTLTEIIDLFARTVDGNKQREDAKAALRREAERKSGELEESFARQTEQLKRRMIEEVFGGVPEEENALLRKTGEEYYIMIVEKLKAERLGPLRLCTGNFDIAEVTPDVLAVYVPAYEGDRESYRSGIYFCGNNIIDFLSASGLLNDEAVETLLRTVAVHELFHAHMNRRLPDGGKSHSCGDSPPGYCLLDEAAANRAAFDGLKGSPTQPEIVQTITDTLFRKYGSGGLPGYGEYEKIDGEAPVYLPEIIGDGTGHISPDGYAVEKLDRKLDISRTRLDAAAEWERLVEHMDTGLIPMYVSVVE